MQVESCAAETLVAMATPTRTVARSISSSNETTPVASPLRCFRVTNIKRKRDDLITIVYTTGDESREIPFARGESKEVFFQRREKAARLLFDQNRADVYCTWRQTIVSLCIKHPSWILFKDSLQQKRYSCGSMQLVVTRYTCSQWKDHSTPCRNCQNRGWRVGCLTPTYLYFLLPFHSADSAELDLVTFFDPLTVERDATPWLKRTPTASSR